MTKGSPTMTCFLPHLLPVYDLKQAASSQPSMQYVIFPNFQQPLGS